MAAIIAILAGILVPMIFNQIDESKITKAQGEVKSIENALKMFNKDTGQWPMWVDATGSLPCNAGNATLVTLLNSQGDATTAAFGMSVLPNWDATTYSTGLNTLLQQASTCFPDTKTTPNKGWKGPYFPGPTVPADPWGNPYVVNSKDFETAGKFVWVLSAGPNGKLETDTIDTATKGDDIGVIIK